jgi:hypothetical protein
MPWFASLVVQRRLSSSLPAEGSDVARFGIKSNEPLLRREVVGEAGSAQATLLSRSRFGRLVGAALDFETSRGLGCPLRLQVAPRGWSIVGLNVRRSTGWSRTWLPA